MNNVPVLSDIVIPRSKFILNEINKKKYTPLLKSKYSVIDNGTASNWITIDCTIAQGVNGVDVTPTAVNVTPVIVKAYTYDPKDFPMELSVEFSGAGIAGIVAIAVYNIDFSKNYTATASNLQINNKNVFRFMKSDFSTGNSMTWETAAFITVFAIPNPGETANFTLNHILGDAYNPHSVILSFDDGAISMFNTVMPLINAYNYKGTFFVVPSWVNASGFMNLTQIKELYKQGHDIGNHGYCHLNATGQTVNDIQADVENYIKWAIDNNISRAAYHFAYPDGVYSSNSNTALNNAGILSARTILSGYNIPQANLKYMYSYLVLNTTTLNDIKTFYQKSINIGANVEFIIHNVVDNAVMPVDVTTELFTNMLNYLKQQSARVMTITEYYNNVKYFI
jgi:peptidoglycan/xylan/chitin deacetylase (PgdA/CDA1 family)